MKDLGEYYKKLFKMKPHIEGGFYSVFYESEENVKVLHPRYGEGDHFRPEGSSIYYLLQADQVSAFHEINSPEIWHYYTGNSAIKIYILEKNGSLSALKLGNPVVYEDANFQIAFNANDIFAAELETNDPHSFALIGCTVSPGFTFKDFKLHCKKDLVKKFPQHKKLIGKLTIQ